MPEESGTIPIITNPTLDGGPAPETYSLPATAVITLQGLGHYDTKIKEWAGRRTVISSAAPTSGTVGSVKQLYVHESPEEGGDNILYICTNVEYGDTSEDPNIYTWKQITIDVIDTDHIADGAITASKIENGAINSAAIATGAISTADMLGSAFKIDTAHIESNAISGDVIANGAITATKISAGAISTVDMLGSAFKIDSGHIGVGAIQSTNISDGAVTGSAIGSAAIVANHLNNNCVLTTKISDGQITSAKCTGLIPMVVTFASGTGTATATYYIFG